MAHAILKVYLKGNVRLYDFTLNDSLFCDELILYDQKLQKFTALGNVNYSKQNQNTLKKLYYMSQIIE